MSLRTKTEHVEAARKRRRDADIPALLQTNDALAGPVKIDSIDYREVKITGGGFEKFMLSQMCWSSFLRLICRAHSAFVRGPSEKDIVHVSACTNTHNTYTGQFKDLRSTT